MIPPGSWAWLAPTSEKPTLLSFQRDPHLLRTDLGLSPWGQEKPELPWTCAALCLLFPGTGFSPWAFSEVPPRSCCPEPKGTQVGFPACQSPGAEPGSRSLLLSSRGFCFTIRILECGAKQKSHFANSYSAGAEGTGIPTLFVVHCKLYANGPLAGWVPAVSASFMS